MSTEIDVPEGLSPDAADLYEDVMAEADLSPIQHAQLIQACRLITLADRAEEAIGEELIVDGYRGRPVENPLIAAAVRARSAAAAVLSRAGLNLRAPAGSTTAAAAALASKRWQGRRS